MAWNGMGPTWGGGAVEDAVTEVATRVEGVGESREGRSEGLLFLSRRTKEEKSSVRPVDDFVVGREFEWRG